MSSFLSRLIGIGVEGKKGCSPKLDQASTLYSYRTCSPLLTPKCKDDDDDDDDCDDQECNDDDDDDGGGDEWLKSKQEYLVRKTEG